MFRPRAPILAAVVVAIAVLSGCGSTRTIGTNRTLALAVSEYRLTPASARISEGVVTLVVHNYGILTHNLQVSSGSQVTAATKPIWPGQTAVLALNLAPGKYQMTSSLLSDQALGVYGTLTVTQ
jgi:Cupredoxin-like domain